MATQDRLLGLTGGVAIKASCVVASTTNLSLSSTQVVDGIVVGASERILVKDQTDTTKNGIYAASSGSWSRAKDFNGSGDAIPGTLAYVDRGTANSASFWAINSSSTASSVTIAGASTGDALVWSNVTGLISGDASAALVTATGSTAARALDDRAADVINVKDYGAVGDGVTDDTAAINAAFDELRTRVNATYNYIYALVYFPPGQYVVSSVNATGIRRFGWGITGLGATLIGATADKAVLDMVHSRFGHISDITIVGDGTTSPKFGVQLGRIDDASVAGNHFFTNVQCRGTFTKADFYNFASEEGLFDNCKFYNNHDDTGTSYCVILDGHNDYSLSSDYQTITATAATAKSFNGTIIKHCDMRKENSGKTVMINGQSFGTRFENSYGVSFDDAVVEVSSKDAQHKNLFLDIHCETSSGTPGVTDCVEFSQTNSGTATPTVSGFSFYDHSPHASNAILLAGSGITTVTLLNVDIRIPSFETTSPLFKLKGAFKVYGGTIYVRDGTQLTNIAEMNAIIYTDDRANITQSIGSQIIIDETNRAVTVKGRLEAGGDKDVAFAGFSPDTCWLENGAIYLHDGITAPGADGKAVLYVDSSDGDLKVKFSDGFTVTIAADS